MCVDFTDLNKVCPKDSYPLLRIDVLVDSTVRHQLLSFMDAFSNYNQIKLDKADLREDFIRHQPKPLLLQSDAIRSQERGHNISKANEQNVCTLDWEECPSLHGRHASKKSTGRRPFGRP